MLNERACDVVGRTIDRLVKRRQRRSVKTAAGWWSDPEDLRQEAWCEALEGLRRANRSSMELRNEEAFVARMADMAMARHQIEMGSPVSETDHHRADLVGTRVVALDECVDQPHTAWCPDVALTEVSWRERVQQRVEELATTDERLLPAVAVRYHGASVAEACDMFACTAQDLYRSIRRLKSVTRSDSTLSVLNELEA